MPVNGHPDPDELRHNLDNLRHSLAAVGRDLDDLTEHQRRSTSGRLSLLHIHAVTGVLTGCGVIATGRAGFAAPSYDGLRWIPGAPTSIGAVLIVLGLVLGVATWRRHISTEMVAACGIVVWYVGFGSSFLWTAASWLLDPSGPKPSFQGIPAYYGWAALLVAHMWILAWVRATRGRVSR
jgi:hypothetical protein